jgi:ArsR family transcriptional regulator
MKEKGLVERMCAYNKAISDPNRMKMIKIFGSAEDHSLNVSAVAEILGISQPATTKHLKIMEEVGLLIRERVGMSVYYSLNVDALNEYRKLLDYAFEHAYTMCEHGYDCRNCPVGDTCM